MPFSDGLQERIWATEAQIAQDRAELAEPAPPPNVEDMRPRLEAIISDAHEIGGIALHRGLPLTGDVTDIRVTKKFGVRDMKKHTSHVTDGWSVAVRPITIPVEGGKPEKAALSAMIGATESGLHLVEYWGDASHSESLPYGQTLTYDNLGWYHGRQMPRVPHSTFGDNNPLKLENDTPGELLKNINIPAIEQGLAEFVRAHKLHQD